MTKGELRKARKLAAAKGKPLVGELAPVNQPLQPKPFIIPVFRNKRSVRRRVSGASKAEQYATYIDVGPGAWDDR